MPAGETTATDGAETRASKRPRYIRFVDATYPKNGAGAGT